MDQTRTVPGALEIPTGHFHWRAWQAASHHGQAHCRREKVRRFRRHLAWQRSHLNEIRAGGATDKKLKAEIKTTEPNVGLATRMNPEQSLLTSVCFHTLQEYDAREALVMWNLCSCLGEFGRGGQTRKNVRVPNEGVIPLTASLHKDRDADRVVGKGIAPVFHGRRLFTDPEPRRVLLGARVELHRQP